MTHKKEQQIKIEGEFKPTVDCLCATHCRFVFIHKGIDAMGNIRVRKDYEISITLNASFDQVEQLKAVSTYDGAEIYGEISEKGA